MTNTGAIVAAMKLRKERHLVRLFRDSGAYSERNAIAIARQSGLGGAAFRSLLRGGAIVESQPDRYWLDEAAYKSMRSRRVVLCAVIVAVAGAAIVAVWIGTRASW